MPPSIFAFFRVSIGRLHDRFFGIEGNGLGRVSLLLGVVTPRWP